jgi:hypothetical protein
MNTFLESEKFKNKLEICVVVFLGITAVLIAYSSWQSSLYGGTQSAKYTRGVAAIGEANSMFTEASQLVAQDIATWNKIADLRIDLQFAQEQGDTVAEERYQWKMDQIMFDNVTDNLQVAIDWADAQEEYASPFDKEGYIDSYYQEAQDKYAEGELMFVEGELANRLGDMLGLVTVIFSVVLFLLGIYNSFKNVKTKLGVTVASMISLMLGLAIMLTVPFVSV